MTIPVVADVLSATGITAERLAEIQRKEQAATAGPWKSLTSWDNPEPFTMPGDSVPNGNRWQILGGQCEGEDPEEYGYAVAHGEVESGQIQPRSEDLAFAADARQAVPELLAEVMRLRAELETRKG